MDNMMRNTKIITLLILVMVSSLAWAESLFVTAKVCPVFSEASGSAKRLGLINQGTEIQVIQKSGDWLKVKVALTGQEGYVQALFTGSSPSVQRSDAADSKTMSTIVARKRASAYTTSAAATRGLSGDNVRERENLAFSDYDFTAIKWLETFVFTDDEVFAFARQEGLVQ